MKWITRQDLRDNPDTIFVFGDNVAGIGLGGQAKHMRGEPNAYGIPTKWRPSMEETAFFHDKDEEIKIVMDALEGLLELSNQGYMIVIPKDGIGTGLSKLEEKSPKIFEIIQNSFKDKIIVDMPTN